jgi:hypothetical protein
LSVKSRALRAIEKKRHIGCVCAAPNPPSGFRCPQARILVKHQHVTVNADQAVVADTVMTGDKTLMEGRDDGKIRSTPCTVGRCNMRLDAVRDRGGGAQGQGKWACRFVTGMARLVRQIEKDDR